jgi:type IV pilus assembly protein PilC
MGTFAYIAKTKTGDEITGQVIGATLDEVVAQLHGKGLAVLHVAAKEKDKTFQQRLKEFSNITFGNASTGEMAMFSRQLATVLDSGIPLVKGLRGLAADGSKSIVSKCIPDLAARIERGESLSDGMAAHPKAFDTMYLSMVQAGERAGALDRIVEELATYLEKTDEIKQKVKSAMSYPVFILSFTIIATLFLIVKIVPTFSNVYEELGQALPPLTAAILAISNAIRGNALVSIAVAGILGTSFTLAKRTTRGQLLWDTFMLKMPIFGPIMMKSVMSRFARTFGILIGSGLPVLESLELCEGAVSNSMAAKAIADARTNISMGHGVTESFRATGQFPEMVLQLMSTGEEAGELDTMMIRAADYYDRQVSTTVDGISALIEPVLIVVVGVVIGVIVVAMFLPIFQMGDAMLQGGSGM